MPAPAPPPLTGAAAGVPYVALPPPGGQHPAPVVVAWHLLDPPRTEAAFAAALPLSGLDAWRIYLGLPHSGSRLPAGGFEELLRLAFEDAVLNLQGPVVTEAAAELAPALTALRRQHDLGDGPLALVGGSIGAGAALLALAESGLPVRAAVLISPLAQLRPAVESLSRQYGTGYAWSPPSLAYAQRFDFAARAGEIAANGEPATLFVVGADDDLAGFRQPARKVQEALAAHYGDPSRAALVEIPGMRHALADEPGTEPAAQTPVAAAVDRHAVEWLRRHL